VKGWGIPQVGEHLSLNTSTAKKKSSDVSSVRDIKKTLHKDLTKTSVGHPKNNTEKNSEVLTELN
jgi:hypothetical protein